MTEHNNPQAYPEGGWEYDGQGNVLPFQHPGMTLLDHFAGLAMQIMFAETIEPEDVARDAYEMADAMLKERTKWIK